MGGDGNIDNNSIVGICNKTAIDLLELGFVKCSEVTPRVFTLTAEGRERLSEMIAGMRA